MTYNEKYFKIKKGITFDDGSVLTSTNALIGSVQYWTTGTISTASTTTALIALVQDSGTDSASTTSTNNIPAFYDGAIWRYVFNLKPVTVPSSGGGGASYGTTTLFYSQADSGIAELTGNSTISNNGNNVTVSSAQVKYGTNSYYFDRDSWFVYNNSNLGSVGNGDFTFDCWIYPTPVSGFGTTLLQFINSGTPHLEFQYNGSGGIYIVSATGGSGGNYLDGTVTNNAWNHLVIMISSGTAYVGVNGTMASIGSKSFAIDTSDAIVGANYRDIPNSDYIGYMDNIRFSNSAIFSTSGYTPPGSNSAYQS